MFSSIVFTLAEIVQPVAPRQTCLAWMLFAKANIRVCVTSVSENKFSPPCSPTTTICDCNIQAAVCSRLLRSLDSSVGGNCYVVWSLGRVILLGCYLQKQIFVFV